MQLRPYAFGSPLGLGDSGSRRPGEGGSDPGIPALTEAQRGGRGHSLLFTVILSCPTSRIWLTPGLVGRVIFRAASQLSLASFHPVTHWPLTSSHRAGAHRAPFTLPRPGGRTGQGHPPHPGSGSDLHPTSDHTQAGWDQRSFSFPRDRPGIWGRGEN